MIRGWDSAVKGLSSGYVWVNGNKKSFAIDMKKPAGLEILRRLAARSDVLLENFAPGVAERLGLGAKELTGANPRLIYCSLSGYGQDGPYRDVKAYDVLIQGEAGIIATTGYPDAPAKVGVSMTDLISSMYAAVGILLALYQREKTGVGQTIDISMFESAVSWLGYFPHHYWHRGEEPVRLGMRHQYITPYGPYLAGDGKYVSLAVASASDWEIFCRQVIRRPDLLEDVRFKIPEARKNNRVALESLIETIFSEHPSTEWLGRLEKGAASLWQRERHRRGAGASAASGAADDPAGGFTRGSGSRPRHAVAPERQPATPRSDSRARRRHGFDPARPRLQRRGNRDNARWKNYRPPLPD